MNIRRPVPTEPSILNNSGNIPLESNAMDLSDGNVYELCNVSCSHNTCSPRTEDKNEGELVIKVHGELIIKGS